MKTLSQQFFRAVDEARSATTGDNEETCVRRCIDLQKKIQVRLYALRQELHDLESAERSHQWFQVSLERSRMEQNDG